ncbi:MAG: hypothetical protein Q7U78_05900 [Gallionella sp.]|nr:hypothetical protein [Gallionella sp.]
MKPAAALVVIGAVAGAAWWVSQQKGTALAGFSLGGIGDSISSAATTTKNTILEAVGMRGIRNNNPGNIRHSSTHWQGMEAQQTDAAFVQFTTPEYGIRALNKLLDTYAGKYGLTTVQGIITRWAPASENNTAAYIKSVAAQIGVTPGEQLNVSHRAALVQAIIRHENGIQPYTMAQINTGVTMA